MEYLPVTALFLSLAVKVESAAKMNVDVPEVNPYLVRAEPNFFSTVLAAITPPAWLKRFLEEKNY